MWVSHEHSTLLIGSQCLLNEWMGDRVNEMLNVSCTQLTVSRPTSLPRSINDSKSREPTIRYSLFCVIMILMIPLEATALESIS